MAPSVQSFSRSLQDGFGAESFHSKCDNKGPTVTIVKSGSFIFGGFTEAQWHLPNLPPGNYVLYMKHVYALRMKDYVEEKPRSYLRNQTVVKKT